MLILWPVILALLAGPNPISMHLSTHAAFAPVTLRVEVRIPKHPENRTALVMADSGDFFRQSVWQLEGESAATLWPVEWRDLPAGEYTIVAALFGAGNQIRGRVSEQVNVLARN